MQNSYPGVISSTSAEILPTSFIKGEVTTYTVYFEPANYVQDMTLVVTVPEEIGMATGNTCEGL